MGIKLISFIVPVYNCGQYIKKCVDSIHILVPMQSNFPRLL